MIGNLLAQPAQDPAWTAGTKCCPSRPNPVKSEKKTERQKRRPTKIRTKVQIEEILPFGKRGMPETSLAGSSSSGLD